MSKEKKIEFYQEILNNAIEDYKTLIDLKSSKKSLIMQGEVIRRLTHELNDMTFPVDEL